jgi:hypothetical protein
MSYNFFQKKGVTIVEFDNTKLAKKNWKISKTSIGKAHCRLHQVKAPQKKLLKKKKNTISRSESNKILNLFLWAIQRFRAKFWPLGTNLAADLEIARNAVILHFEKNHHSHIQNRN